MVDEEESSEEEEYDEEQGTFKSRGKTLLTKNREAADIRSTMNPVMKSSRGKEAVPSKHVLAADASNTAKTHQKQVTLEPEKRADHRHHEPNANQPDGLRHGAAIESNRPEATYVHHTLEPSSYLRSESSLTSVALPEPKRA